MLPGTLGRATDSNLLRDMLDVSMERTKTIADRVSRASLSSKDGFSLTPSGEAPVNGDDAIDIESEMVSLADEQLHFEATAKLLEKAYAQLRLAIKER
ncbi:MAG: hypothetical protein JWM95_4939 [Gemmatimonadetes bacterium]|nr:hypothetical protein [Gemmatimonadota bacterium]